MNTALLGVAAFFAYGFATLFLALGVKFNNTNPGTQIPALAGFAAHSALLVGIFTDTGLHLGFFNSLALFAWVITALFMLGRLRWPLHSLGVLVYPIAGICALGYAINAHVDQPASDTLSPLLQAHILCSVFAYSLLILAALQAIVLAVQDHQIHHHKPGGFVRSLPPLQTMERLMFRIIGVGFTLLTLALLTGFAVVDHWFTHKIIFSLIAWLIFATLLLGRWHAGWRGRQAIRLVLSGSGFLILAFFGSKLVLELILGN